MVNQGTNVPSMLLQVPGGVRIVVRMVVLMGFEMRMECAQCQIR
jgi:hypothetical protein